MLTVCATAKPYTEVKTNFKKTTAVYGALLTGSSVMTNGVGCGISTGIGAITSYAYVKLLSDRVDTIEKSTFQKELLAPLSAATFEVMWNNTNFGFDLDYGSTFIGFLAYKFALSGILYDIVRDILINEEEHSNEQSSQPYEENEHQS